jgi:ribosomal protein S18 acetylase RimI-like enzyme
MKHTDIQACDKITAASDPWKTLHERIDFGYHIILKEAHVCTIDEELAGFVIFTPAPVFARGGYLRAIGVAPSRRGQGVGKMLMNFAEKITYQQSSNLFLCVSSFNRDAQVFYKKLGYTKAGTLPDLIIQHASEYIYWKRLNSRGKR